ncbi:rhomboid family intramembrane serine protease [Cryomorphaceae bacterium 1068]|nr:rhomboid family intramembrane serine protease [Cryomorphaceae bacterium 1068]
MASILDDLKRSYHSGNMVTRFIFLNVGVFVALSLIRVFGFFYKSDFLGVVVPWVAGSSNWETMLFRPWTVMTYMFVHEGLWHLFVNMIMLWFSGRLFGDLLGDRRLVAVYFYGGIAGFLLYFVSYNIFPVFSGAESTIIGASASVIAILVAIATYNPDMEVRLILIGNVKLKFIAIFFVALDILFLDGGNTGGRLAHLGGALLGFSYARSLSKGNDWSNGFYGFVNFFRDLVKPKPKMKVASSKARSAASGSSSRSQAKKSKEEVSQQKKIDEILDKISQSGYDSLTKAEKEFLFNASKK